MPNFPDVIETWAAEINDDGSETVGTIVDALDQNRVYSVLTALQTWMGPNTDLATNPSHEGRLKALEAADALTNPMTTLGDLLYGGDGSGTPARLGVGTTGQVLSVVSGLPAWATPTGGGSFSDPMTSSGDLIVRDAGNVTARLGIGFAGQVLTVLAGLPTWETPQYLEKPTGLQQGDVFFVDAGLIVNRLGPGTAGQFLQTQGASNNPRWQAISVSPPGSAIAAPSGSLAGELLYFADPDWDNLALGANGTFLKSNGPGVPPTWATPAGGGNMNNPMTTLSDLIIASTGGTPARLGIGAAGQVLTVVAGAPAWATGNPMTAQDDLIIGGASGAAARLGKGTNGQVLQVNPSGHLAWANNPAGFSDPTTTRGDLLYHAASGTTRLGLGAAGTVLTSDGTDASWAAAAGGAPDYATANWQGGD